MEVSVERYQRKKYVNQENSPVLYYIRQKAGTAKVVDIDALAEDIQTNCALTTGDGEEYQEGKRTLHPRQGDETGERQPEHDPEPEQRKLRVGIGRRPGRRR